jgi:hypothetical protein
MRSCRAFAPLDKVKQAAAGAAVHSVAGLEEIKNILHPMEIMR